MTDNYGEIANDKNYLYASLQVRIQTQSGSNFTGTLVNFLEPQAFFGVFEVSGVKLIAEPGTTVNITFFCFIDGTKSLSAA